MFTNEKVVDVLSTMGGVSRELLWRFYGLCSWGGDFVHLWHELGNLAEKFEEALETIKTQEEKLKEQEEELKVLRQKELLSQSMDVVTEEVYSKIEERCKENVLMGHANNIRAMELDKRERELEEEKRLFELQKSEIVMFGLGETSNPKAMAVILHEMGCLSSTLWNDYKMTLLELTLEPLREHLANGWNAAKFVLFWQMLLKNEYVNGLMAKRHKNAFINVKLMMNILGWLRSKGVLDLNDSAIDRLIQGKATRRMYLSHFDDCSEGYSLLDAEMMRVLNSVYESCVVL